MTYNLYNVYDLSGNLVLERAKSKEVIEVTGCPKKSVSQYALDGNTINKKYKVEIVDTVNTFDSDVERDFARKYSMECYIQWLELNRRYGTKNK